jgi:hypothetical protein
MSSSPSSQDAELLLKLRDFYSSCLNENRLEDRGAVPLLDFLQTMKTLYRGGELTIPSAKGSESTDLTAALAYLHSRGQSNAVYLLLVRWSNLSSSYLQALVHSSPLVSKVMMA